MDINEVIRALTEARDNGSKRVFLNDMTNSQTLDLVNIEVDEDGDTIFYGD